MSESGCNNRNSKLSNRDPTCATKLFLCKDNGIIPVLLYRGEAWMLLRSDAAALGVFKRKILNKIFASLAIGAV